MENSNICLKEVAFSDKAGYCGLLMELAGYRRSIENLVAG